MAPLSTIAVLLSLGSCGAGTVGWRTDGTGSYPGAEPPVVWSATENVVWKTKMPGRSNASPIVVGDRVFVLSDPAELLCLSAADGAIIWRRSFGSAELFGAERARATLEEHKRIRAEKGKLERALNEAKDDAEKQQAIKPQLQAIEEALRRLTSEFPVPAELANGEATNSAPTPVSDGRRVYALFGNGVVGACTTEGETLWGRYLEEPTIGFGCCNSPLIVDGKLIVHLKDLLALDPETGKELWRTPLAARHASPIAVDVEGKSLVVSPAGAIVRPSDGKVLLKDDRLSSGECTPVMSGGILYRNNDGKAGAFRLAGQDESIKLERLWESKISSGRRTPSPAVHGGVLYCVNTDGILDALDAASGDSLFKTRLNVGAVYSSVAATRDHLYFSGNKGTTVVAKPGREFEETARNELESLGSNLVFDGRRMFVRTREHLYCIGK